MEDLARQLIELVKTHQDWAAVVIFITAFGESLAFFGLLFPGAMLMIGAGALVKSGSLALWPILVAAILGAVLGDALSYWVGRQLGGRLARLWPFTRNPKLLAGGIQFFHRYGGKSVFIARFVGPLRAIVPLAAGMMRMPPRLFWLANVTSALIWAPLLLLAGDVIARVGERLVGPEKTILLVFVGMLLLGVLAALWGAFRAVRQRG